MPSKKNVPAELTHDYATNSIIDKAMQSEHAPAVADTGAIIRSLEGVDPKLRAFYTVLAQESKNRYGAPASIGETLRSRARQKALYAQGRTAPGPIVTKTLNSRHINGRAIDIVPPKGVKEAVFRDFARGIADRMGVGYLGNWDPFHFQV
jgi:peptidoglycan L-alanyl-D-glutamate endopeptidase CwlK